MNDLEAPNVTAYCLVIFSVLTAFLAVPFLVSYLSQQALPQSLPRAGQRNEWMPFVRSCFREYWRGKKTMEEGYDKVPHSVGGGLVRALLTARSSVRMASRFLCLISPFGLT
jgi:hypothetical protein